MFNFMFRITPARLVIAAIIVLFQLVDIHYNTAHAASGWEPSQTLGGGGGGGGMQKLDKAGSEAKNALQGVVKILAVIGFIIGLIMTLPFVGQKEKGISAMKTSGFVFLGAYLIDWLIALGKGWVA